MPDDRPTVPERPGAQRLSREALDAWRRLGYGMFIHFGMSTYDGEELSPGTAPASEYHPDRLDVEQWVVTAAEAGMRYAVLTAKHVAGFCLWPSEHTDYHVGASPVKTDVVRAFVEACRKHGVQPGLYYCSWDNHHRLGSVTPSDAKQVPGVWPYNAWTTEEYRQFQSRQIEELTTGYGPLAEFWVDIPSVLGPEGRQNIYQQIAERQPGCVIVTNAGLQEKNEIDLSYNWPTDVVTLERSLPPTRYDPWRKIGRDEASEDWCYLPAETNDPIGREWFYEDDDPPRSVNELLAMRLLCETRGVNFLLNVPPDRTGVIPTRFVETLQKLRQAYDRVAPANRHAITPPINNISPDAGSGVTPL